VSGTFFLLKNTLGKGDMLGYQDLTPGSDVQRRFEEERRANPSSLRGPVIHTIVGLTKNALGPESALWFTRALALGATSLDRDLSDVLVCGRSQRGATLETKAWSVIERVTHTQEGGSPDLRDSVLELLNRATGAEQFDTNGMPPSDEQSFDVDRGFTCPQLRP
jgi:hypothetical protein